MTEADREKNLRRIAAKEAWIAHRKSLAANAPENFDRSSPLPPGQTWSDRKWPILDLGDQPDIPRDAWRLIVDGLVAEKRTFTFDELLAIGESDSTADFHCVTTWSTRRNEWRGVRFRDLCDVVVPDPAVKFVLFTSYDRAPDTGENYTTNVPLDACLDDDVLLCHSWNRAPLSREHGGPVRMFLPKRYAWKSAKWLWRVTFMERDLPGYWEERGYSNTADPWTDDRYRKS